MSRLISRWERRAIGHILRRARAHWRADESHKAFGLLRLLAKGFPSTPNVHIMLACVALDIGEFGLAGESLNRAVLDGLQSPYLSARAAGMQLEWGDLEGAHETLKTAHDRFPQSWLIWRGLGSLHFMKSNFDEAASCFKRQGDLAPSERIRLDAMLFAGNSLENAGRRQEAIDLYYWMVDRAPYYAQAYYRLVESQPALDAWDPLEGRMLAALDAGSVGELDARHLHYALGHLYDRSGRSAEAFMQFKRANELRALVVGGFSTDGLRAAVDMRIELFDRDFIGGLSQHGCQDDSPIFVVGMPRSGTTLVEQILASHSTVFGLGERPEIVYVTNLLPGLLNSKKAYPSCVAKMRDETVRSVSKALRRHLRRWVDPGKRIIMKTPENFWDLGLIAMLFPNVKIINCNRDPIDTCLSCYMQDFMMVNYATNLTNLADCYQLYHKIMEHWRTALPDSSLLDVSYEKLVRAPGDVIPTLCAFCGLAVEDNCFRFHENRRRVDTVSRWQVRRPLYATSVGRWERYREFLGPLLALGAAASTKPENANYCQEEATESASVVPVKK